MSAARAIMNGPAAGHIHGVMVLLLIAAAALFIGKYKCRPTRSRIAVGLTFGLVVFLGIAVWTVHGCQRGVPVTYYFLAGVSVGGILTACGKDSLRAPFALFIVLAWFALAWHYVDLVHGGLYIGNRNYTPLGEKHYFPTHLDHIRELAHSCPSEVPEGFLTDLLDSGDWSAQGPNGAELIQCLREPFVTEAGCLAWYTPLTLLLRVEKATYGVWSPAGSLSEVSDRLELKPYPPR